MLHCLLRLIHTSHSLHSCRILYLALTTVWTRTVWKRKNDVRGRGVVEVRGRGRGRGRGRDRRERKTRSEQSDELSRKRRSDNDSDQEEDEEQYASFEKLSVMVDLLWSFWAHLTPSHHRLLSFLFAHAPKRLSCSQFSCALSLGSSAQDALPSYSPHVIQTLCDMSTFEIDMDAIEVSVCAEMKTVVWISLSIQLICSIAIIVRSVCFCILIATWATVRS